MAVTKAARRARCPWCGRGVMLTSTGKLWRHMTPSRVGAGFEGLTNPCKGQHKKPEEYTND